MSTNPPEVTQMLRVFKSTLTSMRMVTPSGKVLDFIKHRYYTSNPSIIAELEAELAHGHPYVYVDAKEFEIASEDRDPNVALKKRLRAEILAEMAANSDKEFGDTVPVQFTPASTQGIAPLIEGGAQALKTAIANKVK